MAKLLLQGNFYIARDCNALLNHAAHHLSETDGGTHCLSLLIVKESNLDGKICRISYPHPADLIFVFQTVEVWEQIRRWKNYSSIIFFRDRRLEER